MKIKSFQVGENNQATFGDGRLTIIAGPCVIETAEHALFMAHELKTVTSRLELDFVYKSSFDKANRSSSTSFRGRGMEFGLEILKTVKKEIDVPIITDVHETVQVERVAEVADILQIPAFLSRQTDLLVECAKSGCAVNVKKGQFLAPHDAKNIVDKLQNAGCVKILLTERGVSFGYNNLVVDFRSFSIMQSFGVPVVYDVTHSLQLPGGLGQSTGGQPEFIELMARAGVAAGINAVFLEVHENPQNAPSDGANMLPLEKLEALLITLKQIHSVVQSSTTQI
jgi:2-dehydro-3-deoxyphosphooctonate aldolase (KDO 8-P synthase)